MSGPKEAPDNLFITDWGHPESDGWFTKAWPGKAPNEAWADYTRTDICEGLAKALQHALGLIVEFGDLNGFRNLSNEELGGCVKAVAVECATALARFEAKIEASK